MAYIHPFRILLVGSEVKLAMYPSSTASERLQTLPEGGVGVRGLWENAVPRESGVPTVHGGLQSCETSQVGLTGGHCIGEPESQGAVAAVGTGRWSYCADVALPH